MTTGTPRGGGTIYQRDETITKPDGRTYTTTITQQAQSQSLQQLEAGWGFTQ